MVDVCDVAARDGFQNLSAYVPSSIRAELARRLIDAGVRRIELASFVSPGRVPQMAGAEDVVAAVPHFDDVMYSGLVLNERGYDRLRTTQIREARFVLACTDSFNRRNSNASVEESLEVAERVIIRAHQDGRRASITLAVAFGCPFDGSVTPGRVLRLAERVAAAGADDILFADTIGVAVPTQVLELLRSAQALGANIGVHLHNTRNTGLANAYAALDGGVSILDAAVGGLGGCPFAPRATGNIATEDLLYLLEGEGVVTGIDLDALIGVAQWLEPIVGGALPGSVYRAGGFPPSTYATA